MNDLPTTTTTPTYLLLSGVDQDQLQREFKRAFPQRKPQKEEEMVLFSLVYQDIYMSGGCKASAKAELEALGD